MRKSVYKIDESMKNKFPTKITSGILEDEIEYCKKLETNLVRKFKIVF